jgi:diguanylate cyclase (GGDEF)-like protein
MIEDIGRWYAGADGQPKSATGVVRVIDERYEREQRLAFLSRYDELTGYLNRSHLLEALGEALASARASRAELAFLLVAIDNFGAINDAYGFATADQVFAAVARRIKARLRDGDAIGRYSGSKLGIVLLDCDEAAMHAAAERFHTAVRDEVVTAGASSVAATVSIGGVALPRNARRVGEAVARAQDGLRQARTAGYGRFVAHVPSPGQRAINRANAALSSDLVAALSDDRLTLSYQPVVDIDRREPVFHEGLLRLETANQTVVAATDFIDLAERLGLIRLVDLHALGRALGTLASAPTARMSLNVSAETVGDAQWLSRLAHAVRRQPDVAGRLIVEVTETSVIRHLDEASRFIAVLHDLGARVAIDDFGAGFSSFRNLRSLDIDIVKIAGVFIENMLHSADDRAFVRTLTELARHFDMDVVGEWVEDEETAALLAECGVGYLQGNLTGPASPELPWPMADGAPTGGPEG